MANRHVFCELTRTDTSPTNSRPENARLGLCDLGVSDSINTDLPEKLSYDWFSLQ